MGKSGYWRTVWSRSLARRRCSQKGVRLPGRRPGNSRARRRVLAKASAEYRRVWQLAQDPLAGLGRPKHGNNPRGDAARSTPSLFGSWREAQQDAVVVRLDLHLGAGPLAQDTGQRQPPRPVDPPSEGRVDDQRG